MRGLMTDETKKAGNSLGGRIRGLREAMGLNQTDFGALFGKGEFTVSRWENNKNVPTGTTYEQMLDLAAKHKYLTAFSDLDTRTRFNEMLDRPDLKKTSPSVTALLDIQIGNEMDALPALLQVLGKDCVPPLRISSVEAETTPEHSTLLALVNMTDPPDALRRMVEEIRGLDGVMSCKATATVQGIVVGYFARGEESQPDQWAERQPRKEINPASSHLERTGRTRGHESS